MAWDLESPLCRPTACFEVSCQISLQSCDQWAMMSMTGEDSKLASSESRVLMLAVSEHFASCTLHIAQVLQKMGDSRMLCFPTAPFYAGWPLSLNSNVWASRHNLAGHVVAHLVDSTRPDPHGSWLRRLGSAGIKSMSFSGLHLQDSSAQPS
jgi:hypothetical protein